MKTNQTISTVIKNLNIFTILVVIIHGTTLAGAAEFPNSFPNVVKRPNGTPLLMSGHAAEVYCNDLGKRLPSARELAVVSQSLGSKGILSSQSELDKFYPYDTVEYFDGRRAVSFAFSNDGYRADHAVTYDILWSSSKTPNALNRMMGLNLSTGTIDVFSPGREDFYMGSVYCLDGTR